MARFIFRADASLQVGIGHVMRCLTLADELKAKGGDCRFICREHPGNLLGYIESKGYKVYGIPTLHAEKDEWETSSVLPAGRVADLAHSHWLGASQGQDADSCSAILSELQPDWLIVDHYALDAYWESILYPYYSKLMVIDDLADRHHICNVLVDQTFGRTASDYLQNVPVGCKLLCGARYSLLRPEFAALRQYSLGRRKTQEVKRLLVTMGGIDKDNATGKVLEALLGCDLPLSCSITVVMGSNSPCVGKVQRQAEQMPWTTDIRVGVSDMAQLMADCDLAIGAAGSTSWERCCLGLPTVMVVLADNQRQLAHWLEAGGAAVTVNLQQINESLPALMSQLISVPIARLTMSQVAANVTDGSGVAAVIQHLESMT